MAEKLNLKWILLIGFLVHLPMLRNGFTNYSDDTYVLNNVLVHQINSDTINILFSTYFDGHYHPLTLLSLAITYFFSGTNALGYQITNLLFHLMNCWMVFKILSRLEIKKEITALATLVFAIHPLNVESVARITERKDTQYVLFLLVAVYYFIEFCREPDKRKFYLMSVGCFVLSLLSKGQAVVFPLILYVISWYRYKTGNHKIQHAFILPLFALSGLFSFLNYKAQLVTGYISESESISLMQVITYPSYIITHYISKLFFPFNLSAQYPKPEINSFFAVYVLVILLLIICVYRLNRNKNYLAMAGMLLYAVSVFPMLRIIPISENFMPDRYNYLGIIGFGLFFGAMYDKIKQKYRKLNFRYVLTGWLVFLALVCFGRTTKWKDGFSVWEDAYSKFPDDPYATINYAATLTSSKKDVAKGLSLYQKSIAMDPKNTISKIYYADVLSSLGNKEKSLEVLKEIMNSQSDSPADIANKASVLLQHGRPDESKVEFDKAVRLKPQFAKNRIKRAGYYFNQFLFNEAKAELDTLEDLHSNYADIIYLLRAEINIDLNNSSAAQKNLNEAKKIGCDPKRISELQNRTNNLMMVNQNGYEQMDEEKKINFGKSLYSSELFYQSYQVFSDILKNDPKNEQVINFSLACEFKLNRPDLMKKNLIILKNKNLSVNRDAINYLAGLGIQI
jgi:tetratricopeptide (TPR) repeat protein